MLTMDTPLELQPLNLEAVRIANPPGLDPITFFLIDTGPRTGRLVIECYGSAWSCYWNAIGDRTFEKFLRQADADYLMRSLLQHRHHIGRDGEYLLRIVKVVKQAIQQRLEDSPLAVVMRGDAKERALRGTSALLRDVLDSVTWKDDDPEWLDWAARTEEALKEASAILNPGS